MSLFGKQIESVSETDLQRLLDQGFAENRVIEYKATLPGRGDGDKKEFIKDVVSFANSAGGHIIYGLEATAGRPIGFCPISAEALDAEKLRLEQMARTMIEPVIHGLKLEGVPLPTAGGCALVMEIPRGLFGPHMIRGRGAFVSRNSAGKMEMDFGEIRSAFIGAETAAAKLRDFHAERTAKLAAGDVLLPMHARPALALHLLPLEAFTPGYRCDLTRISGNATRNLLIPRGSGAGWNARFSLDGFTQASHIPIERRPALAYAHVFRTGALEYLEAEFPNQGALRLGYVESVVLAVTTRLIAVARQLEVRGPFYAFASLLNMRGWKLVLPRQGFEEAVERPIEHEHLILPEVMLEDATNPEAQFRPCFDVLWNSCGWSSSGSYSQDGTYREDWRRLLNDCPT